MTITTHTQIYLTDEDIKRVLMEYYKEKGYMIECPGDIVLSVSKSDPYEPDTVNCSIVCNKKRGG